MEMQQGDIEVRVSRLPEGAGFEVHVRGGEIPESRTVVEDVVENLDCLPLVEMNRVTKTSAVAVKVYLSSCGLGHVPSWVFDLPRLTWLDLAENQLTCLPKEIRNLFSLAVLNLPANQLTCLPKEIHKLYSLTDLNLAENQLTCLPRETRELKKLTELYLEKNRLTALPSEIRKLKKLEKLDLSENQLIGVPPWIGELTELTDLFVLECGLSPEVVAEVKRLVPQGCEVHVYV